MVTRRGAIRVPVGPRRALPVLVGAIVAAASGASTPAAELPVPCVAGSCGVNVPGFVTSGAAGATTSGNTLTIRQTTDKAILNWSSFNVSADGRVEFQQPDANAVALNRIFQASPSRILGSIDANGQVYLINQNGLVFGDGARVNVGGLVASSLNVSDSTFNSGLLAPELLQNRRAAFESDGRVGVLDAQGQPVLGADGKPLAIKVQVLGGASLATRGKGGRILLAGQSVENSGKLTVADGQVVLAAGEKLYLQASGDPALRGLVVEVDGGGEAANRLGGEISAPRGNVTLAGLAVNQQGRISASTSVAANGSIRLVARDSVRFDSVASGVALTATRTGRVELAEGSVTTVTPDATDTATAIDEQAQLPSRIEMFGRQLVMRGGAAIVAPGGELRMNAAKDGSGAIVADPESRIRIESDARIDLRGTEVAVPVARNLVTVELRANELRDSPLQRDGVLRGKKVVVDARVGTPLADVSGALAGIQKGVTERLAVGGTALFQSQGDLVVATGASVDVSGGRVDFTPGVIQTTQLIGADGRVVDIGQAAADVVYRGLINPSTQITYDRWGVVSTINGPAIGRYDAGYSEGKSAGTVQFVAPTMVLNGDLRGGTFIGPLQRDAALAPLGGRFVLGLPGGQGLGIPDYVSPSVNLVRRAPGIVVGGDSPLPAPRTLDLPLDFMTRGGFTRNEIYSNGSVTLEQGAPLSLAAGSSLRIAAQRIELRSGVTAPGGSIRLSAERTAGVAGTSTPRHGVVLADGVGLDVRGLWVNDTASLDPQAVLAPNVGAYRQGGTIDLGLAPGADGGELVLGDGSALLAGGGAWRQAAGTVAYGRGGSIALRAGPLNTAVRIGTGVGLDAFGSGGAAGGSLLLEAARIELATGGRWAEAQQFDPAANDAAALRLGTPLFRQHGFAAVTLVATGRRPTNGNADALALLQGTDLLARVATRQLDASNASRPSGGTIASFSTVAELPDHARLPFALELRVEPREFTEAGRLGDLSLASGSVLRLDPQSTLRLVGARNLNLGGAILAPSGTVRGGLVIPGTGLDTGFDPSIAITVASGALIDVSGSFVPRPLDSGVQSGTVRAGGSISLVGARGSVDLRAGSRLDASGTSALLDLPADQGGGTTRQRVASAGGSIELRATESLQLQGELRAAAGSGDTGVAPGGTLTLGLFRLGALGDPAFAASYPVNPRVLRLVADPVASGTTFPNGLAVLDVRRLGAGGFDALRLASSGRVELDAGLDLSLARQIAIDAPTIEVLRGGSARLAAPLVQFGNSVLSNLPSAPVAGAGQLNVDATLLELYGFVALQRIREANLGASDLRLRGIESPGASRGALSVAGNLTLLAGRVAPTTMTEYTLTAAGGADERLRIVQRGPAGDTPLSVGGKLRFVARDIEQGGTVLAPFGILDFAATNGLVFGAGSRTSVSADGKRLPFGVVQGDSWQYQLGGTRLDVAAIPSRRIDASATSVTIAPDATLDLRGGGDLYAYEWQPGTGGSIDALAPGRTSGLYAILPELRGQFAPFDSLEYSGSDLAPGDSIYLAGGGGLAAGFYPLLPARYALLPGAFLVSAVPALGDPIPGSTTLRPDGATVVAGRRTFGTAGPGDTRYAGFAVRPGSEARRLASYEDELASEFFAARAARLELSRSASPADAGVLNLAVRDALDARGRVLGAAAGGGRAASVSITAPRLLVESGAGTPAAAGTARIATGTLASWGIGSLLLGGTRTADSSATIGALADEVTLGADAQLSFDEVLVAANRSITLASGARIATRAPTAPGAMLPSSVLRLDGAASQGAALLAASDLARLEVARSGSTAPGGTLVTRAGATLASRGALLLDAPGGALLDGAIDGAGASWTLASTRLRFGEPDAAPSLALSPGLLQAAAGARELRLAATTMEFAAPLRLGVDAAGNLGTLQSLDLTAATLVNRSGGDVRLGARTVRLAGAATAAAVGAGTASGTLSIVGEDIGLDAGRVDVAGFTRTSMVASRTLDAIGDVDLRVAGALELAAPRVSAAPGTQATLRGDELLRVGVAGAGAAVPAAPFGGGLTLAARDIEIAGAVRLPSGSLALQAGGSVRVAAGGALDVSGAVLQVADQRVGGVGGQVEIVAGGDVRFDADSAVLLDGAAGAAAGRLQLRAGGTLRTDGTLAARGGGNGLVGGSVDVDVARIADFAGLATRLSAGGFDDRIALRAANGDLALAAGSTLAARAIQLVADGGSVRIDGTLVGIGGNQRAEIGLYGTGGVTLGAGGSIVATGEGALGRGGRVELGTSGTGSLDLAPGSRVALGGGAENGQLRLRAPASGNDVAIARLAASFGGLDEIVVVPVLGSDLAAAPTAGALDAVRAAAASYVTTAAPAIRARLGTAPGGVALAIEPGIELRRAGDVTLPALALNTWRFGGRPADVSIRATGTVTFTGSWSDGVRTVGTGAAARQDLLNEASTSLRVAAGARAASANPLAVDPALAADLVLRPATVLRTGTGALRLAAARDVVFSGAGSAVYTTGLPGAPTQTFAQPVGSSATFPTRGGQLSIEAGRDVVGFAVTQSPSSWLMRQGRLGTGPFTATLWGIDPGQFQWNAGTWGGGDLRIAAGRDARDLSAAVVDTAIELQPEQLTRFRGGVLDIAADRDIGSVMVNVADGTHRLRAGGALTRTRSGTGGAGVGSLVSMQGGSLDVAARRGIALESVVVPTLLSQRPGVLATTITYFANYADDSRLRLQSAAGEVSIDVSAGRLASLLGQQVTGGGDGVTLAALPPNLQLQALAGDVRLLGLMTLLPADRGQLEIVAGRDVIAPDGMSLRMSDGSASSVPTPLAPATSTAVATAEIGRNAATGRHAGDPAPALIYAGRDAVGGFYGLPKQARVVAGRDLVDVSLIGQNVGDRDLTLVSAGRDLRYTSAAFTGRIEVGGPGRLDVLAGRDVDLGFSRGITTIGRLANAALTNPVGADLTVIAGLARALDASAFVDRVVAASSAGRDSLVAFVASVTGRVGLAFDAAASAFKSLAADVQRPFLLRTFFAELVASGREANSDPAKGFGRGFAAIDALLPGSRAADGATPTGPWDGDLTLAFSRIYTLGGGDVSLLVPGGLLNVGLANPPANLPITRRPSDLGIVAQQSGNVGIFTSGDVLVNQSRVFTLRGGDIAIWSTTGDIDAGRGAKTAISAPPPSVLVDAQGNVTLDFSGAVAGSGIRAIVTDEDVQPGDVDLIAPAGIVNAGDAGIGSAGNLNVAANQVVGLDNIQVGGSSTGVPAETSSLGASLSSVSSTSTAAGAAAQDSTAAAGAAKETPAPLAESALGWLDVFIEGFGQEVCKPSDEECLKRNRAP